MWTLKIFIKIILSKLPLKYSFWRKLGIFKNGKMNEIDYSKKIFFGHLEDLRNIKKIKNPSILEIGPGDGISSAIFARYYQSSKVYLVDIGDFADRDVGKYKKMISLFKDIDAFRKIEISNFKTIEDILLAFKASYLTNGIESMKKLKDKSVDYIFSHSVMEHIRKADIDDLITEMYRVLNDDGLISHNINYKDHLGESLNNLRFSEKVWESDIFANSGFYTNRIPAVRMHKKFEEKKFNIIWEKFGSWQNLPLKRKYMHDDFDLYSDDELMKCTSAFIAKK